MKRRETSVPVCGDSTKEGVGGLNSQIYTVSFFNIILFCFNLCLLKCISVISLVLRLGGLTIINLRPLLTSIQFFVVEKYYTQFKLKTNVRQMNPTFT